MNPPITALIVDDEPLARAVIRKLLPEFPQVELIGECADGQAALAAIRERRPRLVFLDVQMPGLSGLEVVEKLGGEPEPLLLFVTAYDEYALPAFEANAIDYLLKPFSRSRFRQAVEKALELLNLHAVKREALRRQALLDDYAYLRKHYRGAAFPPPNPYLARFVVKKQGRIFFVNPDEVLWVAASGDYVELHCREKRFLLYDSIRSLETRLDPSQFLRIHRSIIVNLDQVASWEPHYNGEYFLHLRNGQKLKSGRTFARVIRELLQG